jgi:hypothetical protein
MDITAICIVGFVVLGIYKLVELYARRKERLILIDKLTPEELSKRQETVLTDVKPLLNLSFSTLKIALLLIGIGVGYLISFFVQHGLRVAEILDREHSRHHIDELALNSSCILICGGLGLLIAFLIESRHRKNAQ